MIEVDDKSNRSRIIAAMIVVVVIAFLSPRFAIIIFTGITFLLFVYMIIRSVPSGDLNLPKRIHLFIRFTIDFFWDLFISNIRLAVDVFSLRDRHRCQLVCVPIDDLTPWEVAVISHRITLTPGTLSCVVTEDQKSLVVHSMYTFRETDPGRALRRPIDILKGKA